jgi:predicted transposase YdaD
VDTAVAGVAFVNHKVVLKMPASAPVIVQVLAAVEPRLGYNRWMITDPIFYRVFKSNPETFFLLLGMDLVAARETAARYEFDAVEFKETSHRADGVFCPREPGLPVYFLEVQFYWLPTVFADLLVKAYTYLKQHDPGQQFQGVVLFASRELEPEDLIPYQALLDAGLIQRYYLDEMDEQPDAPLGLSVL